MNSALVLVIVLIVTFAIFSLFFVEGARHVGQGSEEEDREPRPRPWWGNPLIWVGASAVFLLLGLFVAPHFLPGIVLFLPFIWIGRPRVRRFERRD